MAQQTKKTGINQMRRKIKCVKRKSVSDKRRVVKNEIKLKQVMLHQMTKCKTKKKLLQDKEKMKINIL